VLGEDEICGKIWLNNISRLNHNKKLIILLAAPYFFVLYWLFAGIFLLYDILRFPRFLRKYKIQPTANKPLDMDKLIKGLKVVAFNQLIINWLAYAISVIVFDHYQVWDSVVIDKVPSFPSLLKNLFYCSIIYEVIFYVNHRLLHHRLIYKYFHKMHHEWTAPIAVMAVYCHPVEHVLCNFLPMMGSVILRIDLATTVVFNTSMLFFTTLTHSGLDIPFISSIAFHDYHHSKSNECYGTNGFLDMILGTSEKFDEWQRNKSLESQSLKAAGSARVKLKMN
jgi:fatty acid hydroxylase domain-containing protein 2